MTIASEKYYFYCFLAFLVHFVQIWSSSLLLPLSRSWWLCQCAQDLPARPTTQKTARFLLLPGHLALFSFLARSIGKSGWLANSLAVAAARPKVFAGSIVWWACLVPGAWVWPILPLASCRIARAASCGVCGQLLPLCTQFPALE